jgi:hypothetical protein
LFYIKGGLRQLHLGLSIIHGSRWSAAMTQIHHLPDPADKPAIIESILMRAAGQIGDVTAPAMEAFYRLHPEAIASFESLSRGWRCRLEGQMIENTLYCLMRWFEAQGEITIMLLESVPHHDETLHVPADWYHDLIDVTAEVIATTIPVANTEETSVWREVRNDLRRVIDTGRKLIRSTETTLR